MSEWDGIEFQPLTDGDLARWEAINRTSLGDPDEDDRCQPIGCDMGRHVPGCQYEEVDREGGVS